MQIPSLVAKETRRAYPGEDQRVNTAASLKAGKSRNSRYRDEQERWHEVMAQSTWLPRILAKATREGELHLHTWPFLRQTMTRTPSLAFGLLPKHGHGQSSVDEATVTTTALPTVDQT